MIDGTMIGEKGWIRFIGNTTFNQFHRKKTFFFLSTATKPSAEEMRVELLNFLMERGGISLAIILYLLWQSARNEISWNICKVLRLTNLFKSICKSSNRMNKKKNASNTIKMSYLKKKKKWREKEWLFFLVAIKKREKKTFLRRCCRDFNYNW